MTSKTSLPMNTTNNNPIISKPLRYIAIIGSTAKSCRELKLLLNRTSYYCLIDRYKDSRDLINKESFYLPDCVILASRSLFSMFFISKQAKKLKEIFPGIKLIIYYNMSKRYPLLEQKNSEFPAFYFSEDERDQVDRLKKMLQNERI